MLGVTVAGTGRQNFSQVTSRPVADPSVAEQRVAVSELEVANCDDVAPESRCCRNARRRAHFLSVHGLKCGVGRGWPDHWCRKRRRVSAARGEEVERARSTLRLRPERIRRGVHDGYTRIKPWFRAYERI